MRILHYSTVMMALFCSLILAISCDSSPDDFPIYPHNNNNNSTNDVILNEGTWRCYYVNSEGEPQGWSEYQFNRNGRFIFYEYFTQKDSLSREMGDYQFTPKGFTVQFDHQKKSSTYDFKLDDDTLTLFYPNNTHDFFYLISEKDQNYIGNWYTMTHNGYILQLSILQNHTLTLQSTAPNGEVKVLRGNYDVYDHTFKVWWGHTMNDTNQPDIWFFAVDRNEMYNNYNGGTLWTRNFNTQLKSLHTHITQQRKTSTQRYRWHD